MVPQVNTVGVEIIAKLFKCLLSNHNYLSLDIQNHLGVVYNGLSSMDASLAAHVKNFQVKPNDQIASEHLKPFYDGKITPDNFLKIMKELRDGTLAISNFSKRSFLLCFEMCACLDGHSGDSEDQDVLACMIHSLFQEYKLLHKSHTLQLISLLFAWFSKDDFIPRKHSHIALNLIRKSLSHPPGSVVFGLGMCIVWLPYLCSH